ncbi:MAG: PDZ domain-containing protein, partial [Puniceicoccales bacterium]|nr:PDZ domain-containing protein [Puniceicoccales bacterium]
MMSIWKRFLLWGVIFAYFCRSYGGENGGNLCVETSVSRTFKHGKNKQPNADISFKEPQFASLEQSSAMRLETICMMKCLEEVHYLHKKLKNLDFKKILEEYVTHIDISKMFLLQSEIDDFTKRFASTLDVFLNGGSLTPGFSIFDLYRQKVRDRVRWIFQYIDRNQFDLYSDEIFIFDREKEDFVRHREALEKLWTNRLNFEIINEIVLKESAERRREQAIIDASSKEENRKIALFFREILYRYRLAKACRLEPQKPSKVHRPVPLNVGEVFAFNRSLLLPCYAVGNVYRLHFDGVDIKLPLTLEKKIERAKKNIKRRYQSLLNNVAQLEAWIVQEQFLNSVARVYDPHTAFMSHESMEDLRDMLHHSFVGIGAYLGDENGHCVVKELVPGGPAAKSKAIQIGDHIVAIAQENEDYVDTTGMLLNKITKLLRGAKGTRVFIKIQPVGDINELKTVPLIRDEIELMESRASGKIFNLPDGEREWRVGVIHLPGFYGESEKEVGNSDSMADMLAL